MKRILLFLILTVIPTVSFAQYTGKSMAKLCYIPPKEAAFIYVDAPIVQMWAPEDDYKYMEPVKDCIKIVCPDEMDGKALYLRLVSEQGSIYDLKIKISKDDPRVQHVMGFCFDFPAADCSYKLANAELAVQHAEKFPLWGKLTEEDPYGNISMVKRELQPVPHSDDIDVIANQALALDDHELVLYLSREILKVGVLYKDANKILRQVFKTNSNYVKDVLSEDRQCDVLMETANLILKQK